MQQSRELTLCQVALCTSDPARSVRVFMEGLGFADAGTRFLWGEHFARIQKLPTKDDAASSISWLVGREDFFQLELFHHSSPVQRPLRPDWTAADHGWSRWSIVVPDFDAAIARLGALGVDPLTAPVGELGQRRVCIREPGSLSLVELIEEHAGLPGGIRERYYDLGPAVHSATVSVADLDVARGFWVDTLGLTLRDDVQLHGPEHEVLWGLEGTRSERFVVSAGDGFIEVVRYDDPVGRPQPEDRLLSDQGIMNVAVGHRRLDVVTEAFAACAARGYPSNTPPPDYAGGTYLTVDEGLSVELLVTPRELDPDFGFQPKPIFRRPRTWAPALDPRVEA
ncbi:MAG: hypothetical protein AAGC46_07295 [Solirubrobacteraceae bacterium]|nr:hypothetical protein [Patulibacter sp.]